MPNPLKHATAFGAIATDDIDDGDRAPAGVKFERYVLQERS